MSGYRTTIRSFYILAILSASCLLSKPVTAAGFYFPEVGTPSSLGTGGVANATNTCGADMAGNWENQEV